jgi:hypothetical protein
MGSSFMHNSRTGRGGLREAPGFAVPILGLTGIGYGIGDYTARYATQDQAGDLDVAVFCGDVLRRGEARSKKQEENGVIFGGR